MCILIYLYQILDLPRFLLSDMSKTQKMKLVAEIFLWNLLVNLLLRFSNVISLLTLSTPKKAKKNLPKSEITRIVGYVDFVLNRSDFILKKTCLKRSLVLYHFLRRYDCDVGIHIGVRKGQAKIAGHSWLTLHGQVFADSEEQVGDFKPIYNYPN